MTFEIPFDAKISLAQHKLRMKLFFQKNLRGACKNVLYSVIILLLAWFFFADKHKTFGDVYLALGLFLLFNSIFYLNYYLKTSKKNDEIHREKMTRREKNKDTTMWEINEDTIRSKDMYYEVSVKWEAFQGYRIVQGNLFLKLAETLDGSIIIGEAELGAQDFQLLIAFVDKKTKNLDATAS